MCFYEKEKFKDALFFGMIAAIIAALVTLLWW